MLERYYLRIRKKLSGLRYKENIPFISMGLCTGLVCCLYAKLFAAAEELAQVFFAQAPYVIFIVAPLGMVLAFLAVQKMAQGASGSGIPQVICCLEGQQKGYVEKFLSLRVAFVKVISSIVAIFSGAAIGREGPSLQISAAIGNSIGRLSESIGFKIKNEQLIIAGAASGLAAAFNTPIGGIVYAVEELTQDHVRSYKTVLLMSVLIAGFTAQLLMGNYLYLGYPQVISKIQFSTILTVSALSFFSGFLGAMFSKLLLRLIRWRKTKTFKMQLLIVLLCGVCIALSYFFLGPKAIFSGKESINFVLFSQEGLKPTDFISRFMTPLLSSMTGIAGGIFAPSLSAGATLGGFVAPLFDPSMRTLLGLAGMVGFLTGVTHTPITSFVLVLEMTDRHAAVFPMMLAAVFSSLGARVLGEKSFYEESAEAIRDSELLLQTKKENILPPNT